MRGNYCEMRDSFLGRRELGWKNSVGHRSTPASPPITSSSARRPRALPHHEGSTHAHRRHVARFVYNPTRAPPNLTFRDAPHGAHASPTAGHLSTLATPPRQAADRPTRAASTRLLPPTEHIVGTAASLARKGTASQRRINGCAAVLEARFRGRKQPMCRASIAPARGALRRRRDPRRVETTHLGGSRRAALREKGGVRPSLGRARIELVQRRRVPARNA